VDFTELKDKAREIDFMATKLKELEKTASETQKDDLSYIGSFSYFK
jgi:proteasome assembly chaperone (PAC2) family protein